MCKTPTDHEWHPKSLHGSHVLRKSLVEEFDVYMQDRSSHLIIFDTTQIYGSLE